MFIYLILSELLKKREFLFYCYCLDIFFLYSKATERENLSEKENQTFLKIH